MLLLRFLSSDIHCTQTAKTVIQYFSFDFILDSLHLTGVPFCLKVSTQSLPSGCKVAGHAHRCELIAIYARLVTCGSYVRYVGNVNRLRERCVTVRYVT